MRLAARRRPTDAFDSGLPLEWRVPFSAMSVRKAAATCGVAGRGLYRRAEHHSTNSVQSER